MGRYLSVGVLGVAAALSASFLPHFIAFVGALLGNFTPLLTDARGQLNLVMILVICWSLRASLAEGFVWALVGGLCLDLLSILPVGASSAALMIIAYVVNSAGAHLLRLRILFLLAITALATVFMSAFSLIGLFMLGNTYDIASMVRLVLLPTLLYNLIAVLPVHAFVRLLQRRLEGGLQIAPHSLSLGSEMAARE